MADPLDLVSFNIRNGRALDGRNAWPFRRAGVAEFLGELDADVIGLQEAFAFQRRYLSRRLPDYTVVGDARSRFGEATPVFVRGRVLAHATRWFDLRGGRFPRIATTARVEVRGQEFTFTCTHLDEASAQRRRASAEQLVRWLRDTEGPHVIVGDFNDTLDDPMFATFAAAGFRSALPAGAGGTTHHFTGRRDGRQIDHILVPATAEVLDAHVAYSRMVSDHWPVAATIRFRGGGRGAPPRGFGGRWR